MKKHIFYFFLTISVLIFILTGCGENNTINSGNTVSVNRTSTEITINNTTVNDTNTINEIHIGHHEAVEEELASFSTKLGGKDTPRSRNIKITTTTLNGTTVNNGDTFSFCDTIGNPTAEMGYEEADSFNADGETVKTFGGGNCQVSSTLYNVVLQINDLEVKERHAHIKPVHYVEKDKDATVAYGSVDFKFKNNTRKRNKNLCRF